MDACGIWSAGADRAHCNGSEVLSPPLRTAAPLDLRRRTRPMSQAADATVVEFPRAVPAPDMTITTLGPARIDSPMAGLLDSRRTSEHYVDERDRVLLDDTLAGLTARGVPAEQLPGMEPCGPRRKIFFDPAKTPAATLTSAG